MKKWRVRFRYIAPYDYHTPLFRLPEEVWGGIVAETPDEAWQAFLEQASPSDLRQREWYSCLGVEEQS